MRHPKCGHCPLRNEERVCRGQNHPRMCTLTDATSPDFRPGYDEVLRRAPTLMEQAVSFVGAVAEHVVSGSPASLEEKARRLAICSACEHHQDGQCTICGCSDRGLDLKTGWAEQSCPLDPPRWGPVKA